MLAVESGKISYTAMLVAMLASASAHGQDAAAPQADEAYDALPNIVVTATKRADTILNTPAAISAITADALGAGGIQDIGDLQASVPNLSVGDQFGVNRTFIRGIGMTSIDLGADGAVAFLQDGAMIARPSAQLAGFYDLAQVEVLRGPQGTIYGRGATAGAINMVTKKPTPEFEGYVRATYGNYDAMSLEAAVGGPLGNDRLMFRVAGKLDKRDGYGKNLVTGNDVDDRDAQAVRGSLLFEASDDLQITLVGDYFHEDDNNYAFHYFGTTVVPEDSLAHNLLGGETIFDYYAARGEKADLRNIYSDEDAINRRHGEGITALVDWSHDAWALKSVTAYRNFKRFNRDDLDVSDVWMFGQNNYDEKSKTFSQEFTLTYTNDSWEVMAGAMYFHEKLFGSVQVPTVNLGLAFGLPADTFDEGFYWQNGTVKTNAYGTFLQASYDVTSKLRVTAGARYNYEKKSGVGTFQFDALGITIPTDKSEGWGAVTPKLLVEYRTDGGVLFYGTVTRGFKSGVINVGSQNDVIDPEFVWNYEAGFKTKAFDDRVSLNAAAFYYDYKDLQVGFVNENSIVETINAASARNYGLEVELQAKIARGLNFDAFATYLNAKFKSFCTGYYRDGMEDGGTVYGRCPTNSALVSLKGNQLPNAPEFSFGAGLTYTVPLGEVGDLDLRAEMNWQDRVYFTEFNNQDATQAAYALVNLSASFKSVDEHWSASAWVRNLTDKDVIANNIVSAPLYGSVRVGSLMPPRTYGLTIGYSF